MLSIDWAARTDRSNLGSPFWSVMGAGKWRRLGCIQVLPRDLRDEVKSCAGARHIQTETRPKKGDRAAGEADITAAKALNPDIVAEFSRYGVN
jgi:hypothetical protein